ncbi:MAG: type II toxin-antitoxin system HipA family toxin [Oscillospiraceae bacterium]|nr:type II toxin-antitoxin system HipA family toxin [Oscillospiraceae bacterium]
MQKTIYVYENWSGMEPVKLGSLYVEQGHGKEHYAFAYDEAWLTGSRFPYVLDPDLALYRGRQYPINKTAFGLFADSSPDRWGRMLMMRREKLLADKEGRKPRKLLDSDYLLGVYDETRMGAIRFSLEEGGAFLSDDRETAAPPWATLRSLEEASREFEKDENALEEKWLAQLIRPGSSLGGARPKATVQDVDGSLWIAKFPSRNDEHNTGAWEKVVHDLARLCGLDVPESRLETFSKLGSTFLVKRFDRTEGRRVHFASAMTMLGKVDGASGDDGTSYLELVSFLKANGAAPKKDLPELWRRIVFNMAVSNTDDHLRNHGFLLTASGWRLSPMYDVNPVPYGEDLALNVSEDSSSISFELAIETAVYYGMNRSEAEKNVKQIADTVKNNWERLAARYGISRGGMENMRPAFSQCYEAAK